MGGRRPATRRQAGALTAYELLRVGRRRDQSNHLSASGGPVEQGSSATCSGTRTEARGRVLDILRDYAERHQLDRSGAVVLRATVHAALNSAPIDSAESDATWEFRARGGVAAAAAADSDVELDVAVGRAAAEAASGGFFRLGLRGHSPMFTKRTAVTSSVLERRAIWSSGAQSSHRQLRGRSMNPPLSSPGSTAPCLSRPRAADLRQRGGAA